MKDKKGLTLIEIILSLAILGIVCVGFLTAMSSYFKFFNKTKQISQSAYETQHQMELLIDKVRKSIRDNEGASQLDIDGKTLTINKTAPILENLKSGGVQVNYFKAIETHNNRTYVTLVSDFKPNIHDILIKLYEIKNRVNQGNIEVPYGYGTGNFSVIGSYKNADKNDPDNEHNKYKYNHLLNAIEWYVSSDEFNMPIPDDDEFKTLLNNGDPELLHYYPVFPQDYILVENDSDYSFYDSIYKEEIFPNLGKHSEKYEGVNVIFAVTPGAKSGKIGIRKESNPVFISGLPVTKDLVIHLDAAFLDPYDSLYPYDSDASGEINQDDKETVEKWNDLSSIYGRSVPNESATIENGREKPKLLKTDRNKEIFRGQYVRFSNQNQMLTITNTGNERTNNKNICIFAAVRNNSEYGNQIFMRNGESHDFEIPTVFEIDQTEEWIIIKKIFHSTSNNFKIGGSNVDIAEIAVYNSAPSNEEIEEIENYFLSKYKTNVLVDNGNIIIGGIESGD